MNNKNPSLLAGVWDFCNHLASNPQFEVNKNKVTNLVTHLNFSHLETWINMAAYGSWQFENHIINIVVFIAIKIIVMTIIFIIIIIIIVQTSLKFIHEGNIATTLESMQSCTKPSICLPPKFLTDSTISISHPMTFVCCTIFTRWQFIRYWNVLQELSESLQVRILSKWNATPIPICHLMWLFLDFRKLCFTSF